MNKKKIKVEFEEIRPMPTANYMGKKYVYVGDERELVIVTNECFYRVSLPYKNKKVKR